MIKKKYAIQIIWASAILLAIGLNLKSFFYYSELFETKSISELSDIESLKIKTTLLGFFIYVFLFGTLALFNYSWKTTITKIVKSRYLKSLILVGCNIAIICLWVFMQNTINEYLFADFKLKQTPFWYYLYRVIPIIAFAIIEAYFIVLISNMRSTKSENVKLRAEKAKAELASLKEQVSPHFLFNTLNSLSSLIRTGNKEDSLDFVEHLAQVYRYILDSEKSDLVTIAEELDFLKSYLFLLEKRFGNSLKIVINISEQSKALKLPPMSFQLLIENVVKHNQLSTSKPIIASIEEQNNRIVVRNNINKKATQVSHGFGLANLNKRYNLLTNMDIQISNDKKEFCVKLPIIKS